MINLITEKIFKKIYSYKIIFTKYLWKWHHRWLIESYYTPKKILHNNNKKESQIKISHIATFSRWNTGDIMLPLCVKDSFNILQNNINWKSFQIALPYSDKHIRRINNSKGLIIGGGGVFISRNDPNRKHPSSWHWNCTTNLTKKINVPIVFFAVGYNQFRNSEKMPKQFSEHLLSFSKNIKFIGMRNYGSVNKIKEYLPKNLHNKVHFQPCPTTIISKLYPSFFNNQPKEKENQIIGVNCAFDRSNKRFGNRKEEICISIADAIKNFTNKNKIKYIIHSPDDRQFVNYLDKLEIKYDIIDLVDKSPIDIINTYQQFSLVIGMRGHSQMIPFGCKIPIISLISHDKLGFFLKDIDRNEWGIDVNVKNLTNELISKTSHVLKNNSRIINDIESLQCELFKITKENSLRVLEIFNN